MTNLLDREAAINILTRPFEEIEFTDEIIDALARRLIYMFGSPDAAIKALSN